MLSIILDVIVIVILIASFLRGVKKGLLGFFIGMLSLIVGILGGRYFANTYSDKLANAYIISGVSQKIEETTSNINYPTDDYISASDNYHDTMYELVEQTLNQIDIPFMSLIKSVLPIIENMKEISGEYITNVGEAIKQATAEVISKRIAYFIIFIIAFFIIQGVAFFVFSIINSIFKLPIIGAVNRLAGGLLSTLFAALILTVVFWFITIIMPFTTNPGGILSQEVLSQTKVAFYFVDAYDFLFESYFNIS